MEVIVTLLPWIQTALSIALVVLILLQQSDAGLGAAFGGGDGGSASFNKKRGFEKLLFNITIIVALLWALAAIIALFI